MLGSWAPMPERRRLLTLLAFLFGTALLAFGAGYLATGGLGTAIMPSAQAWAIGAVAGVISHLTRASLVFAGAVFTMAELYFLAPYLVPVS